MFQPIRVVVTATKPRTDLRFLMAIERRLKRVTDGSVKRAKTGEYKSLRHHHTCLESNKEEQDQMAKK
jgi:hypothetical protein